MTPHVALTSYDWGGKSRLLEAGCLVQARATNSMVLVDSEATETIKGETAPIPMLSWD